MIGLTAAKRLRLISVDALIDLMLRNYDRPSPKWCSIMLLHQVLVVVDPAGI
ncbi:hypothetical protein BN979_01096 [Mycolicibacterium vulneris]|nr:hypothetical protein BN979_01096 [Mycolicibacterium vulneris]